MKPEILLIHPPLAKPSEPPAGIMQLYSCLADKGVPCAIVDANLEGILYLTGVATETHGLTGRRDSRACKNREANLSALRNHSLYRNFSRYSRVVEEVNHLLRLAGKPFGINLSLSDYNDPNRSPVRSTDLLWAADCPEKNPFYGYFSDRLLSVLTDAPEYLGFSMNFLSQALCTMAMIGFIKKRHPGQKVILGGSLVTSWVSLTGRTDLFSGLVDHLVAGPGEAELLRLLQAEETKNDENREARPADHLGYLSPGPILPYSAARGCWWRKCSFCPETAEENPYQPQPIDTVTADLHSIVDQQPPRLIHLLDSSLSPALLIKLAAKPLGSPWYGFARVTQHLADEDFCRQLRAGGCIMLKLGLESGDQNVLDRLNKGIDLAMASAALQTLKKAGIGVYGYFLFGTPPEDEVAAMRTLDFIRHHRECLNFLNLALFNLPSISPEAMQLETEKFYDGDLSLYKNFRHPAGWHRFRVRTFLEKTIKKDSAVSPIVQRTPPFFTSNHAPFFLFQRFPY